MDNSEFNDSEGVIDHDLLYDLNAEHIYDDGPFGPGAHYNPNVVYDDDDDEDNSEYADYHGAGALHEEFISDDDEGSDGIDVGFREGSEGSSISQVEEAGGNGQQNVASEGESESEDEYSDERFAEVLGDLEYDNQGVVNNGPLRAARLEDHDWDHEEVFEGDDQFDEEDDLGDHYLRLRYPILEEDSEPEPSDDLRSESSEIQDSDYGSSINDFGSIDFGNSPSPSPVPPAPAPPHHFDNYNYVDLVARNDIPGTQRNLQSIHQQAALNSILGDRGLAMESEQREQRAQREARRMERAQEVAVERFGREVVEPPPPARSRRRTAAQAFGDDGGARGAGGQRQQSPISIDLIDLTEEPDSPPLPRQPQPHGIALPNAPEFHQPNRRIRSPRQPQRVQNPRRQGGIRRTPSLARSDGSLLGPRAGAGAGAGAGPGGAQVIDLTGDEPPPPQRPMPPPPARGAHGWARAFNPNDYMGWGWVREFMPALPRNGGAGVARDILEQLHIGWGGGANPELEVQFLGQNQRDANANAHQPHQPHHHHQLPGVEAMLAGRHHHLFIENPLANNHPGHLNYAGNGFAADEPRQREKPVHLAPSAPREGFTRTSGDCVPDDTVMICASCEGELSYDADEKDEPPAKKARTRKDQEEHHFWIVKSCGHVYCRSCYENRSKKTSGVAFKVAGKKITCAVDGCDTDVNQKQAWVGVFL